MALDPNTLPTDPTVGQSAGYSGALSEFVGPYVSEMLGKGAALADMPYTAYTGPLSAGASPLQEQAFAGYGGLDTSPTTSLGSFSAMDAPMMGGLGSFQPQPFFEQFEQLQQPQPARGDVQISPREMQQPDPRLTGGMDFMEFFELPVEERLRIRQEGLDAIAAENPPPGQEVGEPVRRVTDTRARLGDALRRKSSQPRLQPQLVMRDAAFDSGSRPSSLEEVLAERGFTMPERPTGYMTRDVRLFGPDPVTGRMRQGSSGMAGYYSALDEMYAQNPEALEIAKQYNADPTQFGGQKPTDRGAALGGQLAQTIQPPQQPSVAAQYMNPYLQAALDPQLREARRQADISRVQDAARLTKAGAFGGSRQAIMESEGRRNLGQLQSDITAKGYADAFEKARAQFNEEERRRIAAEQADRRYGLDALSAMERAGARQRDIEQEGITADYLQFEKERKYPYEQLAFQQSLLSGLPLAARQQSYIQPSGATDLFGGIGGILGLLEAFGYGQQKAT